MKKIPTIFMRDQNNIAMVTHVINPAAEWVFRGEGRPTRKFDGSPVLVRDGGLFKRYDCKHGRTPPPNFEPADDPDPITGHWPGWVPINDTPDNKWFRAAIDNKIIALVENSPPGSVRILSDGSYEAIGPHFQGNPERVPEDILVLHGEITINEDPRTYEEMSNFLFINDMEGIVWHHPDGRMAKVKARDFGIKRGWRR